MTTTYGFHAHDGWWFKRLEDGTVQMAQTDPSGEHLIELVTFDPYTWASIVASVSKDGETPLTYPIARDFHIHGAGGLMHGYTLKERAERYEAALRTLVDANKAQFEITHNAKTAHDLIVAVEKAEAVLSVTKDSVNEVDYWRNRVHRLEQAINDLDQRMHDDQTFMTVTEGDEEIIKFYNIPCGPWHNILGIVRG